MNSQDITDALASDTPILWTAIAAFPNGFERRHNGVGNLVIDLGRFDVTCDAFDAVHCSSDDGWDRYDTDQDAPYFGIWFNVLLDIVVTLCEGDLSMVVCENGTYLDAELTEMDRFYHDV